MLERHEGVPGHDVADDDPLVTARSTSEQLGLGASTSLTTADRIGLLADRVDELRDRPVLIGAVVLLAVALVLGVPRLVPSTATITPIEERIPQVTLTPTSAIGAEPSEVIVHVSGAVGSPGVYTLDATSRVVDAVEAAGGASVEADLDQLNLAALVVDGQQIHVPVPGEPARTSPSQQDGPIDLNQADVIALQELPGVGPATAEAIVAFRTENGPFRSVDDLLDVPGIGPAKLAAMADAVVVR